MIFVVHTYIIIYTTIPSLYLYILVVTVSTYMYFIQYMIITYNCDKLYIYMHSTYMHH